MAFINREHRFCVLCKRLTVWFLSDFFGYWLCGECGCEAEEADHA